MLKEIKNKSKKWLCKATSQYRDGKLVVSGHMVIISLAVVIAFVTLVGSLIFDMIYALYSDPLNAIHNFSGLAILVVGLYLIMWLIIEIVPWYLLNKLAKHAELTCDRIIFPEDVKSIFTQIEALDKDKQAFFMKGLNPLLRKIGEDV